MNRVVADVSICGAWILPDESTEAAVGLLKKIESGEVELVVPSIWIYEIGNLLKSANKQGRLTKNATRSAQKLINEVPVGLCDVPSGKDRETVLELSFKHKLSYYDSSYLELSRRLKVPLLTNDIRLREAAEAES